MRLTSTQKMATNSSVLAWKIPRTEEPDGLQSLGLQGRHNTAHTHTGTHTHGHTHTRAHTHGAPGKKSEKASRKKWKQSSTSEDREALDMQSWRKSALAEQAT